MGIVALFVFDCPPFFNYILRVTIDEDFVDGNTTEREQRVFNRYFF